MRIITPEDGFHYFFGYYDLMPFDSSEHKHLCHRVPFMDRLPEADDRAQLGEIDLETGAFTAFAETTAWNFQQGAMLRRFPAAGPEGDHTVLYNVRDASSPSGFAAEILCTSTGRKRRLPAPAADVSRDGRRLLSVNFSRIYDFRPGYGYAGKPDPWAESNAPEDDGVFLADTETGDCRLLLSYARIRREFPQPPFSDGKLLVNHITFNPAGDRFLFLLRNFPEPGQRGWKTQLIVSDLDGNMKKLTDYCVNSHYHWKNDREILIVSSAVSEETAFALWLMNAETGEKVRLPEPNPAFDIHCIYSPNRRWIVGDSYPGGRAGATRSLWLIDTERGVMTEPVRVDTVIPPIVDIRCDLHVRWSPSGRLLSFDSTHTGKRTVVLVTAEEIGART
ncbi:MAG: hypothetical protein IKX19_03770 [Clostridia bacterium]|nr:hypothetical protein [Clostridia bacterium]